MAWAARLGFLADLLSRPVLVGYIPGVAVAMVVSQLPNVTGIAATDRDTLPRAAHVIARIGELQVWPFAVSLAVVVTLTLLRRFPRLPAPLLVVLAAAASTSVFDLAGHGVTTIGSVPGGLPALTLPGLPAHLWPSVLASAAGICVVIFSDNILTARAFAARNDDHIDANQELLALSGSNGAAGLLGGFPVSSSGSRTALADVAGGRTQMTSLVAAAVVIVVLLFGGTVLESFPLAALGGLVIIAAVRLIDVGEMRRIAAFRRREAVLVVCIFPTLPTALEAYRRRGPLPR